MSRWLTAAVLLVSVGCAQAGTATLTWTAPTQRTDGSPLTNLAGFALYERCGTASYGAPVSLPASAISAVRSALPDGVTCYWQMTAIDAAGVESARTAEVSKTFPAIPPQLPGAPGSLVIEWQASAAPPTGPPDVAVIDRVQTTTGGFGASGSATATFPTTPVAGNLLIVQAMQRGGVSASVATISGSGWTKRTSFDYKLGDGEQRHSIVVFEKVAGASEPTSVTVTWSGVGNVTAIGAEYSHDMPGGSWSFASSGNATWETAQAGIYTNGWNPTPVSGSVSAGTNLVIGIGGYKAISSTAYADVWTSLNLIEPVSRDLNGSSYPPVSATAWLQSDSAGTKQTTFADPNQASTTAVSATGIVLVYQVTAGGGGTSIDGAIDALTITEHAAAISLARNISTTADALAISEAAAIVGLARNIAATLDTLAITEHVASVTQGAVVNALTDSLVMTEQAAAINAARNILATTDALLISELAGSLGQGTNLSAGTDTLTLTERTASLAFARNLAATVASLILTERQANVNLARTLAATADSLGITERAASVALGVTIAAEVDALSITERAAVVSGVSAVIEVAAARLVRLAASNRTVRLAAGNRTITLH